MRPNELVVRCYARRTDDDVWEAFCVDLTLAARGESFQEAKQNLQAQVQEYILDALTVDKEHAAELLSRKAPWYYCAKWEWLRFRSRVLHLGNVVGLVFRLPYPALPRQRAMA